ncbi:MAG: hypothetical protein U1F36_02740 [Planctomycetota bacterium]
MDSQRFVELTKVFFRRAMRGDFQSEHARDDERAALAAAGTTDALSQDYLAWRRALLAIAAVALTVTVIVAFATHVSTEDALAEAVGGAAAEGGRMDPAQREQALEQVRQGFGKSNLDLLEGISAMLHVANLAGAIFVAFAARAWLNIRKSRKLARRGWLIMFATPLGLALLPWAKMLELGHLGAAEAKALAVAVGLQLGIGLFLHVAPKAIALFPGTIRSSMTLKTLLPEHAAPGWVAAIIGPLYAVFLVAMITILNQMTGDFVLLGAIGCLMASPCVLLYRGRDLLRSHTPEEATTLVKGVRRTSGLFSIAGIALFAWWIIQLDAFSVGDAITFVFSMLGNVMLLTVVVSDFVLALLNVGYRQTIAFHASPLSPELTRKYDALTVAGITEIRGQAPTA